MNVIWGCMVLTGIVYGIMTGNAEGLSETVLFSAKEAVNVCITMLGVMGFWMGIMEIAQEAGLIRKITGLLKPVIAFLFPEIPKGHRAVSAIASNFTANFLGLGWAATPAGLEAMDALTELEKQRARTGKYRYEEKASDEMCTFLILNISSLQLIPLSVIAYRAQYGSINPSAIIGPGIAASAVSTGAAILFCKCMNQKSR